MKIAYVAHDLTDPAVHRRMRMFALGGATATPIGFQRRPHSVTAVEGVEAIDLGVTVDGRLTRRAASIAGALTNIDRLVAPIRDADAIVARNLDMLLLAARARARCRSEAPLVYECLDIHRTLLSNRPDGALLRLLETRLWRDVGLILTSSPAFVRNYFLPRRYPGPIRLVENKILLAGDSIRQPARAPGPPWRIGWFGMIRCRKSFAILSRLTRAAQGAVEVVIRGRPSMATFVDLEAAVASEPYMRFAGGYRNPDDLPEIYGDVHLNWAIDFFEQGGNSEWLLPNRIYEGCAFGAPPIALASVETGRWLAQRDAGVVLGDRVEESLAAFLIGLDRDRYAALTAKVEALPQTDLICSRADCRALVDVIGAAVRPDRSIPRRSDAAVPLGDRLKETARRAS